MTQLNQNTTDLQAILNAVNALPEASNTEIGVSYNADGTQNLIIKDDGSVIEIPDPNPVLLWTNASPTSNFGEQTLTFDGDYDGFIIEAKPTTSVQKYYNNIIFAGTEGGVIASTTGASIYVSTVTLRPITAVTRNSISFGTGRLEGSNNGTQHCIPTRIWGVKFTL